MAEYEFYCSSSTSQATAHPVFFYHIPKCGGMTVHSVALHAWTVLLRYAGIERQPIIARCDTEDSLEELKSQQCIFLSSHYPFGIHKQFLGVPRLLTILRAPVSRVVSGYTYNQMRSDQQVATEGVREFLHQEENINLITKTLVGKTPAQPVEAGDLEQAMYTLDNQFSFVATTEHIKTICEAYLRFCGLPNVLTQRINPTLSKYRLDADEFEEEIVACNSEDAAIFERTRERGPVLPNPRPSIATGSSAFNPLTVVIAERGDQQRSRTISIAIPTGTLVDRGILSEDGAVDSPALDAVFNEAAAET